VHFKNYCSLFFKGINLFFCWWKYPPPPQMFVCFEQFFSYLATVTIAGDRAANLDLCLALTAFSSDSSFTCHTYCDTGPPFLRSYPKDRWFYLLNAVLLAKEQSLPILNVLGLMRPVRAGLKLTTSRLLSESTTTRLRQATGNCIIMCCALCKVSIIFLAHLSS
jgi:hypothetical protein